MLNLLHIVIMHDRRTGGNNYFKRRIRAYITLLKTGTSQQCFGIKAITITFTSLQHMQQIVEWTRQELTASNELAQLGAIFYFRNTALPLDTQPLWLGLRLTPKTNP